MGWRTAIGALALVMAAPAIASGWALGLHGGAGVLERGAITAEDDRAARAALAAALARGTQILEGGGTALDAVEAVVVALEDAPMFNAGHGAVLNAEGRFELDAAIMEGTGLAAGAVTGVTTVRNPVRLARAALAEGRHVFLAGAGAEALADRAGVARVANRHFETPARRRQWEELREGRAEAAFDAVVRFGTVGAVARDRQGRLAAATSTGGLTGKAAGRIGDSPVIGAGTVADDRACAVSATGSGEMFLRARVAGRICEAVRLTGAAPGAAARDALDDVARLGGNGGVVVVGREGPAVGVMNAAGMFRAFAAQGEPPRVAIHGDED